MTFSDAVPLHARRRAAPALALLATAALGWPGPARGGEPTRAIVDMAGRTVTLPARIARVASNGGAIDQWLLMLGAGRKMVATSRMNQQNPVMVRIFPGITDLPAALDAAGGANVEELLRARPDVFLVLSGVKSQAAVERAGIPVVVFERRTPAELSAAVRLAGEILGPEERSRAEAFATFYEGAIARVTARTGPLPAARRPRVLYVGGVPASTEGRGTLVDAWITSAGGVNVAAREGIEGMGRAVSMEAVLRWDPEVVVAGSREAARAILESPTWKDVAAVRTHRVHVNPKGVYLWSVRSAEAALQVLWAARTIHPELFGDLDVAAETRAFYLRFYGYRLSERELADVLEPP